MIDLEQIKKQLLSEKEIENILSKSDWRNFENFVEKIFESNDFKTKTNFRFKTKNRYEIDLLAVKNNFVFCVDCKSWGRGRYKKSALKESAKRQEERVKELKKFLKRNEIAKGILDIHNRKNFYSVIITLFEEDFFVESETIFVPVWKLNSFLNNFEEIL